MQISGIIVKYYKIYVFKKFESNSCVSFSSVEKNSNFLNSYENTIKKHLPSGYFN